MKKSRQYLTIMLYMQNEQFGKGLSGPDKVQGTIKNLNSVYPEFYVFI